LSREGREEKHKGEKLLSFAAFAVFARKDYSQNFPELGLVTGRFPDRLCGSKQRNRERKIYGTHL
jgi:hypothetical protein